MSVAKLATEIVYPESDGQPMGETDWHIEWTFRIRDILKQRYKGQRVYVTSDLLLYFVEGKPKRCVVPDGFVVKDCDPRQRRTFKIWEEDRVPNTVFEITSASTQRKDTNHKPKTYATIGVAEYFLYDPCGEYLAPALQGYRLDATGEYSPIVPGEDGSLVSAQLGISLELNGSELVLRDLETGSPLLTQGDAEHAAREAAEAEVSRLRDRLKQLGDDIGPE